MFKLYRTQYDRLDPVYAKAGTMIKEIKVPVLDKEGRMSLVVSGVKNLYDEIQSHADSVDIHVILDRYARGDLSALSRIQGVYGDTTDMPTTYAELLNVVIKGENEFMQLPVEVRAKFDHSYQRWMAAMDNMPSWLDAMGYSQKPATVTDIPKGEVENEA